MKLAAALLLAVPTQALAQGRIYFSTAAGPGLALPQDGQLSADPKIGLFWEIAFGWAFTRHWAFGIDFTTWQTSLLGIPYHYHSGFNPRLEFTPQGPNGLAFSLSTGLGTTDGVLPPLETRQGLAVTGRAGYQHHLGRGVTLRLLGGLSGHIYTSGGGAWIPFVVSELRFAAKAGP